MDTLLESASLFNSKQYRKAIQIIGHIIESGQYPSNYKLLCKLGDAYVELENIAMHKNIINNLSMKMH